MATRCCWAWAPCWTKARRARRWWPAPTSWSRRPGDRGRGHGPCRRRAVPAGRLHAHRGAGSAARGRGYGEDLPRRHRWPQAPGRAQVGLPGHGVLPHGRRDGGQHGRLFRRRASIVGIGSNLYDKAASPRAPPPRWSSRSSRPARPPMPDIDIVALGEPLVELNQTRAGEPQYQQGFGGDTPPTPSSPPPARRALRLPDAGGRGQPAAGTVEGRGVDTSGVEVDPTPIPVCTSCSTDPRHSFSYLRRDSAASRMTPASLKGQLIERARYLHVRASAWPSAPRLRYLPSSAPMPPASRSAWIPTCVRACAGGPRPRHPARGRRYARPTCSCPAWTTCST